MFNLFITLFGCALVGMIFFLLLSIARYNKETPALTTLGQTLKGYFTVNVTINTIAVLLLTAFLTFINALDGGKWVNETFFNSFIEDESPTALYVIAFLTGAFGTTIAVVLGRMKEGLEFKAISLGKSKQTGGTYVDIPKVDKKEG